MRAFMAARVAAVLATQVQAVVVAWQVYDLTREPLALAYVGLAQFIPILRTFAPVVAGVGEMGYPRFAASNVVGAILWVGSMTLAGYALGSLVPNIEQRIHSVVALVIAVSLLPPGIAWLRSRKRSA